jgi:acyl-CoA reductase-like NAD-dependent aldehyde dehydrogenase
MVRLQYAKLQAGDRRFEGNEDDWVLQLGRASLAFSLGDMLALVIAFGFLVYWVIPVVKLLARLPAKRINVPYPEEAEPEWKGEVLDEPKIKLPRLSAIVCYCPATGQRLGHINPTTVDGVSRAIKAAGEAQVEWAKTTFEQRRQVLKTLLQFILDNQETIARVAARDSGKPILDASFGEILVTVEKLQWTITHGEKALAPEARPTNFLMMYKENEVRWEPLGVVAACISWNYPFHNFFGPLISSLFAGNAIVIKPSERTAWSSNYFLSIARAALTACGHSPHLVHSLPMWPQTAGHLTSHPGISHITFIGSRPVAKHVLASASKSVTPVCVELGGKDPSIILDDASDLPGLSQILLRGVFQSAGQNCIGIERIIAMPKVYSQLIKLLEPKIRSLRLGSGLDDDIVDVGAMVSSDNFDFLEELIEEAVADGARLLAGGHRYKHPKHPSGHYFEPTMLVDVTPDMRIAQEELFSPVCLIMKADSVENAIEIANSTSYALGASVFGFKHASEVVSGVRAGMVAVNDFAVFYVVQLPFGGVGGSGYGRFAGYEGLRSVCNSKSVCRDRFPRLIATKIPPPHHYPIKNAAKAWSVAAGVVWLGYGGLREKAQGLWNIISNM